MTSGDDSFNYFPENQLTKFIAAPPPYNFIDAKCVIPLGWTPLSVAGVLPILHCSFDCLNIMFTVQESTDFVEQTDSVMITTTTEVASALYLHRFFDAVNIYSYFRFRGKISLRSSPFQFH